MRGKSSAAEKPSILLYVQFSGTFKYFIFRDVVDLKVIHVVKSGTVASRV